MQYCKDLYVLDIHALYYSLCISVLWNLFCKGLQCTCNTGHRTPKSIIHFTKISNLAIRIIKHLMIVFAFLEFWKNSIGSSWHEALKFCPKKFAVRPPFLLHKLPWAMNIAPKPFRMSSNEVSIGARPQLWILEELLSL